MILQWFTIIDHYFPIKSHEITILYPIKSVIKSSKPLRVIHPHSNHYHRACRGISILPCKDRPSSQMDSDIWSFPFCHGDGPKSSKSSIWVLKATRFWGTHHFTTCKNKQTLMFAGSSIIRNIYIVVWDPTETHCNPDLLWQSLRQSMYHGQMQKKGAASSQHEWDSKDSMVYYGIVMTVMTMNGFHDQPLNLIQLDHGIVFCYLDADCQRAHDVPPLSASLGTWVRQPLICTKVTVTQLHSYRVTQLQSSTQKKRDVGNWSRV